MVELYCRHCRGFTWGWYRVKSGRFTCSLCHKKTNKWHPSGCAAPAKDRTEAS